MNEDLKDIIRRDIFRLCGVFSVSGFEYRAEDEIRKLYGELFDEIACDRVGNILLVKRCGKSDCARIAVDTHMDEVGMMVTEILDGGFCRITSIGGLDPSIMQAADVVIYGKGRTPLFGVIVSTPPHLRSGKDGKLPRTDKCELLVDVGQGYTKEELEELMPIGTPVGFAPFYSELEYGCISGKSFDNKACCAVAARAVADTPREKLAGDVYLLFSAREESSHTGGVTPLCFSVMPDYAMTVDVNLGEFPEVPKKESVPLGKGVSVDYSAATDRHLTRLTAELCREKNIPFTPCAAPSSTGTNATSVNLVGMGIPVVDVGLPLLNMHTYNEIVSLDDCASLYSLVGEFISSEKIREEMRYE